MVPRREEQVRGQGGGVEDRVAVARGRRGRPDRTCRRRRRGSAPRGGRRGRSAAGSDRGPRQAATLSATLAATPAWAGTDRARRSPAAMARSGAGAPRGGAGPRRLGKVRAEHGESVAETGEAFGGGQRPAASSRSRRGRPATARVNRTPEARRAKGRPRRIGSSTPRTSRAIPRTARARSRA